MITTRVDSRAQWCHYGRVTLNDEKTAPAAVPADIEIAEAATLTPIAELAAERLGISGEDLVPYGHTKAKVSLDYLRTLEDHEDGTLVLVTAMSPTPAGEGKTTTAVGLADGLSRIGKKAIVALREPPAADGCAPGDPHRARACWTDSAAHGRRPSDQPSGPPCRD